MLDRFFAQATLAARYRIDSRPRCTPICWRRCNAVPAHVVKYEQQARP